MHIKIFLLILEKNDEDLWMEFLNYIKMTRKINLSEIEISKENKPEFKDKLEADIFIRALDRNSWTEWQKPLLKRTNVSTTPQNISSIEITFHGKEYYRSKRINHGRKRPEKKSKRATCR